MEKMKSFIRTHSVEIYAVVWSVGLFFSTFLCLLVESSTDWLTEDVSVKIILPYALVMVLYLWEEAYNLSKSRQPRNLLIEQFVKTFVILGLSILFLVLIGVLKDFWRCVFGLLGWICVSFIKYWNLKYSNPVIDIESH